MASPFDNLLQASQFAVQTRLAYDQMAMRGRENVQGLLQRRAEQAQQGEQFLSEMNARDRQLEMASRQFDESMKLEKNKFERQDFIATSQLQMAKEEQARQAAVGAYSKPWYALEYYKYRTRPNEAAPPPPPPTKVITVEGTQDDILAGYRNLPTLMDVILDPTKVGIEVTSHMMGSGNYAWAATQAPFKLSEMTKNESNKVADTALSELKKVQMAAQTAAVSGGTLDPISTSFTLTKVISAYETTKGTMDESKRKEIEAYLSTMQQLGLIPKNEQPKE